VGASNAALCRRGPLARLVEPAAGGAGPLTLLLKFVHLAAISIWSAGLIVLPFMFRQRGPLDPGWELDRLHRMTRFVYVEIASPAAVVAIGSGTALIFLQATFQEWFSTKLVLVGAMAMLHVVAGLVLGRLFLADGRFGRASCVALSSAYIVLITAIIWIVLAKPHIDSNRFATDLFRPGALGQFFGATRIPTP
jgi:protoporphyrinogen IX oxidase